MLAEQTPCRHPTHSFREAATGEMAGDRGVRAEVGDFKDSWEQRNPRA